MVLDHEPERASRWAEMVSITGKIGCTSQTLNQWEKKAEHDNGKPGLTSDMAGRFKVLEQENRELCHSLAGARHELHTRASCLRPWIRPHMIGGPVIAAGWCIAATEAASMSRLNTPSAWVKLVLSHRWAAWAIAITMLSPKTSTTSTMLQSAKSGYYRIGPLFA